jgi:hypothetical protein
MLSVSVICYFCLFARISPENLDLIPNCERAREIFVCIVPINISFEDLVVGKWLAQKSSLLSKYIYCVL